MKIIFYAYLHPNRSYFSIKFWIRSELQGIIMYPPIFLLEIRNKDIKNSILINIVQKLFIY